MPKSHHASHRGTKHSVKNPIPRLQRIARDRADNQARRIPWQRLLEARNQYIDWQEFNLWVRSVLEIEEKIPAWLVQILDERCPGFVKGSRKPTSGASGNPLPLRLEDWIEEQIFAFARQEGWFNAIAYYAIRDPRYQRAEVCWAECVRKWKRARPIRYPSFEEWKSMAVLSDSTAHLSANEPKLSLASKSADPDHLSNAVSRYMDWEAFAYWVRPALENASELPVEVVREPRQRCSGYLDEIAGSLARESRSESQSWDRFMNWIADHFFEDAQKGGWFDAVLIQVRNHPRAIRTMEYADHCDELCESRFPSPYPSFEEWRRAADSYVETNVS